MSQTDQADPDCLIGGAGARPEPAPTEPSWREFLSFRGRAPTLWPGWSKLIALILLAALAAAFIEEWIAGALGLSNRGEDWIGDLAKAWLMVLGLWPTVVRRLHDMGRSGAWSVPAVAALFLFTGWDVFHARGLSSLGDALIWAVALGSLLSGGWLLSRPGEPGPNRYGPEPRI